MKTYGVMSMKKMLCFMLALILLSLPCMTAFAAVFEPSESYKNGRFYDNLCQVTMSGNFRQDIANVALSQVGYHEGKSEGDLSGASTGKNNYTQYGADFGIPSDSWCAAFVWWCARNAGIGASVIPKTEWAKTMCFGCPFAPLSECGSIRIGDLAFFDNSGNDGVEDHVGIIVGVTDDEITTVEGNFSNSVKKRTYARSTGKGTDGSGKLLYIGYPDYERGNYEHTYATQFAVLRGVTECYENTSGKSAGKTLEDGEYLLLAQVRNGADVWYQVADGLNGYYIKDVQTEIVTVSVPPVSGIDPYTATDVSFEDASEPTSESIPTEQPSSETTVTETTASTTVTEPVETAPSVSEQTAATTAKNTKDPEYESFFEDEWLKYALYAIFGVLFLSLTVVIVSAAKGRNSNDDDQWRY